MSGQLNWEFLRERVAAAERSTEASAAAAWALDVLEDAFGSPDAWRDGCAPGEIAACFSHIAGLIGTLELALALSELHGVHGVGRVCDAMAGSGRPDQFASPRIQLKLAALAKAGGIPVRLEPKTAGPPADLLLDDGIVVEVLALVRDAATLAADRWLAELTLVLQRLGREHGARFDGEVREALGEAQTAELLEQLESAVRVTATGLAAAPIRIGGVTARVTAVPNGGGGSSFRMPSVDHARRLAGRLRGKAEQTARSGASWVFGDVLSDMWRLTPWSRAPLAEKSMQLAQVVRAAVGGAGQLRGVVMSDGAAVLRPGEASEEWADIGLRALKLQLDPFRVRETITIALGSDQRDELALWERLMRAEAGWVARALRRAGLAVPPELS